MIISAWKPKTKVIDGKQQKIYYTKFDINKLGEKGTSGALVIWKCDGKNCKFKNQTHAMTYYNLTKRNSTTCNMGIQFCPSCQMSGDGNPMYGKTHTDEVIQLLKETGKRSKITIKEKYGVDNISLLDETKIKKNQLIINFDNIEKIVKKDGYELLTIQGSNKYAIIELKCKKGHIFKRKWVSYNSGHIGCRQCFYNYLSKMGIKDKEGFKLYKIVVDRYTKKSYKRYKNDIGKRSKEHHLDHKYSKCEGFKSNIPPYIIGSYVNLEILTALENCTKQEKCSITKEKLFNEYFGKDW